MTHQLDTAPSTEGFGASLCLHLPGCCPAGSVCSIASATEFQLSAAPSAEELLGRGDATDLLQAREILSAAQRGRTTFVVDRQQADAAAEQAPAYCQKGAVLGLAMKRSLRRFLEKRAARLREFSISPYPAAEEKEKAT